MFYKKYKKLVCYLHCQYFICTTNVCLGATISEIVSIIISFRNNTGFFNFLCSELAQLKLTRQLNNTSINNNTNNDNNNNTNNDNVNNNNDHDKVNDTIV